MRSKSTLWRSSKNKLENSGGKSDTFAITTDDQWKLQLPSLLDVTGSEKNSTYSTVHLYCMPSSPEILLGTATCFEYCRSYVSCKIRCDHNVTDTYLSLRYICYYCCGPVYIKLNFEALRVLRNANHRVCLLQVEIRLYTSHLKKKAQPPQDEYETDSEDDFSDTDGEDLAPISVSRSGRPIRSYFRLDL